MKRYLFLLLIFAGSALAMFEVQNEEPTILGTCFSNVATGKGIQAAFFNPAGIADNTGISSEFFFKSEYSGIDGLKTMGLGLTYKRFGLSIVERRAKLSGTYSGGFGEGRYALSFGNKLNDMLSYGVGLKLYKWQDPRYGTSLSPSIDLGFRGEFYRYWSVAALWVNSTASTLRGDPIPSYVSFGVGFAPSDVARTYFSLTSAKARQLSISLGEEVNIVKDIFLIRGGILKEGDLHKFNTGFTVNYRNIKVIYALSYDEHLPLSHSVGIIYRR